MANALNRRDWLKANSLAALAMGFSLPSLGKDSGVIQPVGINDGVLNLGSNENPYGISPKAKEALVNMLSEANRYQFNVSSLSNFKKILGNHFQVSEDHILATAGSGDALNKLARHFNKGNLVTATPTFGVLPNTAKKLGTKVVEIPLTKSKVHDLPAMLKAINSETQTVYICNPANPTSTIVSPISLKAFCIEASKKAVVIVDEAYIDFLDAPDNESMIGLINQHPNIIVVRTFSKIHAMAGLRIGFVVAHPNMIRALGDNQFSNTQITISNLTMAAAIASLKDEAHLFLCKQKNAAARTYTIKELMGMQIACIPSYTNFIFFPLGNYSGSFEEDMFKKKVILHSYKHPDGNWARVSIGTMDEMKRYISIMKADWKG